MSFLTKTATPRSVLLAATRTPVVAPRYLTTSPVFQKSATDSVKDGLKKVDRVVSDNVAIPAVDAVASAKEKLQSGADKVSSGQATREASGKAAELKGEAKGAAAEAEGKAKGAAERVKQNL